MSRSVRKRGEKRRGLERHVLGERGPAWGRWEGAICETRGHCGEDKGGCSIPFVRDGEGPFHGRVVTRRVPTLLWEGTAAQLR